jgi:hypothetical protein
LLALELAITLVEALLAETEVTDEAFKPADFEAEIVALLALALALTLLEAGAMILSLEVVPT